MKKGTKLGGSLAAAVLFIVLGATPTNALPAASVVVGCGGGNSIRALSFTTHAATSELSGSECGTMGVRNRYAHPGGTYWTPFTYDIGYAVRWVSNTYCSHHTTSTGLSFTFPAAVYCPM